MSPVMAMRLGARQTSLKDLFGRVFFPATPRGLATRYAFAVVVSLITFGIRAALEPILLDHSPLLLFTLPVAVTAICTGAGPALASAGLSTFLGSYFFSPYGMFGVYPDHVRIGAFQTGIFWAASAIVAKLGGEYRRRRWETERTAEQLRQILSERDAALERVSVLTGLLPVCAACKSIRDEHGNWRQMEEYLSEHSKAKFTHGMCPACMEAWYGDEMRRLDERS
jgi:K+-sensing histidine kinase KdpD